MKPKRKYSQFIQKNAPYSLLALFPDTILFEYNSTLQALFFTSNISCCFKWISGTPFFPFQEDLPADFIYPADAEKLLAVLRKADSFGQDKSERFSLRLLAKSGEYRWTYWQIHRQKEAPFSLIGKLTDIHEEFIRHRRLIEKYSRDAMTGALNRECAEKKITELLSQIEDGFLFMLDIDNFKEINDTLGHSAGDRLLALFVEEMKKEFCPDVIIGRMGGDEFVIFMPNASAPALAIQHAKQLLFRFSHLADGMLTASIGIAAFPADGSCYLSLYDAADTAMYTAKRNGKNNYCFFRDTR